MRTSKLIHIVSCHAEGEVGDVIVGGVPAAAGRHACGSSRGSSPATGRCALSCSTSRAAASFATSTCSCRPRTRGRRWASSSWSPRTRRRCRARTRSASRPCCSTPASCRCRSRRRISPSKRRAALIAVVADCRNGKAERISVENVPSFVDRLDAPLEVAGLGTLKVDIAYGGDSFVIVDAAAFGFRHRARRGARSRRDRHADHRGGQRAIGVFPPRERGLGPHLVLPVRRVAEARGRGAQRPQRGRRPPRQDRPLADRNRLQRPDGDAAAPAD